MKMNKEEQRDTVQFLVKLEDSSGKIAEKLQTVIISTESLDTQVQF